MFYDLPHTFKDYIAVRKKYERYISYNYPLYVKVICRYSGPSVFSNRSCGDVTILAAGKTGAGKSKTFNVLFNKKVFQSHTTSVCEIEVPVIAHDHQHEIRIPLKFIDVPGARDVNESMRSVYQENIKKYLETSPNFYPRSNSIVKQLLGANQCATVNSQEVLQTDCNARAESDGKSKVFPNLILLFIQAMDNRMEGENSEMAETLKLFRSLDVVDEKKLNVIVVVTHAASLPNNTFSEEVKKKTKEILEILVDVLGPHMEKTKIVFVENKPEKWGLEKVTDGDFYQLPDKTKSHYNLIKEMTDLLLTNGDKLGALACISYFADKNSNKTCNIVNFAEMKRNDDESPDDHAMHQVQLNLIQELPLQFLGHGFCPILELEKSNTVLAHAGTKKVRVGKTYYTHSLINDLPVEESEKMICVRLSQDTLEEYNRERLKRYGLKPLDSGSVFSLTRVKDFMFYPFSRKQTPTNGSVLTYLYEWRIRRVEIASDCQSENFSEELNTRLKQLPSKYDNAAEPKLHAFFNEWGSHFVQSSYLGGSIMLVSPALVTLNHSQLQNELRDHFKFLLQNTENQDLVASKSGIDYSKIEVFINGGLKPQVTHLNALTSEIFQQWIQTIESYPVELQHFLTLKPYYLLTEEPLKTSLEKATLNYIHEPHEALPQTRENVAHALVTLVTTDSVTSRFADERPGTIFKVVGVIAGIGLGAALLVAASQLLSSTIVGVALPVLMWGKKK